MQIEWKTRLCTVNDKLGYFHAWEHYSKPLEASPLIGGAPAGVFSKIFGIVEFSDGVRRVDPTDICFAMKRIRCYQKWRNSKMNNDILIIIHRDKCKDVLEAMYDLINYLPDIRKICMLTSIEQSLIYVIILGFHSGVVMYIKWQG